MIYSRREFAKLALASVPGTALMGETLFGQPKPNSLINGVQVGTITYSYRSMPDQSAQALLKYVLEDGISAIELMGEPAEQFAGAPSRGPRGGPGGGGRGPGAPGGDGADAQRGAGGGGGTGRGQRQPPTPEQQAAQREARESLRKWRTTVSMDKYKDLRKLYNDAGVKIYALKISPGADMTDDEMDYVFNAGAAVGDRKSVV